MRDFAEKIGFTPAGLVIFVLLALSIVGVLVLVPTPRGAPTVKVPDGFNLEKSQANLEQKRAAADLNKLGGAQPAGQPSQQSARPAQEQAPAQQAQPQQNAFAAATIPVSGSGSADIGLLADRVGRDDPFAPVLQGEPEEEEVTQVVEVFEEDIDPGIDEFNMPSTFPEPLIVRTPSFVLNGIFDGADGKHFVMINNEIINKGDTIPGSNYYLASIDTRNMNSVTLESTDPMASPVTLRIKRHSGDVSAEIAVDGTRSFSNMGTTPPSEDEMFMPETPAIIEWKQSEPSPGGLPLPGSRTPRSATGTIEFRQPEN